MRNRPWSSLEERDQQREVGLDELSAPPLPTIVQSRARSAEELEAMPFVSVLVPTTLARQWSHETIFKCWRQQTYPKERREMLVLDIGDTPSPFFTAKCRDSTVRYFHDAAPPPAARTVGGKRNWLAQKAQGTVLAAFDDDDIYMPDYLERMVGTLQRDGASIVKLATWLFFDASSGSVGVFDAEADGTSWGHHMRRWGFGFSYVYTADVAREVPFKTRDVGEDYAFALAAASSGKHRVLQYSDRSPTACCVHVLHGTNQNGVSGARQLEQASPRTAVDGGGLDAHFACARLSGYPLRKLLAAAINHHASLRAKTASGAVTSVAESTPPHPIEPSTQQTPMSALMEALAESSGPAGTARTSAACDEGDSLESLLGSLRSQLVATDYVNASAASSVPTTAAVDSHAPSELLLAALEEPPASASTTICR